MTFALEEKNLPYDSVLIELRSKPHWYKDKVPTELTPAAVVNGELVYESLDILKVMPSPSPHDYRACCRHTGFLLMRACTPASNSPARALTLENLG